VQLHCVGEDGLVLLQVHQHFKRFRRHACSTSPEYVATQAEHPLHRCTCGWHREGHHCQWVAQGQGQTRKAKPRPRTCFGRKCKARPKPRTFMFRKWQGQDKDKDWVFWPWPWSRPRTHSRPSSQLWWLMCWLSRLPPTRTVSYKIR